MLSLINPTEAKRRLADQSRQQRLSAGLTQAGLAARAGVSLATLRKFEQTGVISLESFLKIQMVLGTLESIVDAVAPKQSEFATLDEVLTKEAPKRRKRGWRK